MSIPSKVIILLLIVIDSILGLSVLIHTTNIAVLNPAGIIAAQEKNLMIVAILLMLIAVLPVLSLIAFVAFKYRASNTNAAYTPDWNHNTPLQAFWWILFFLIVVSLSTITWIYTHKLDPSKAIASGNKAMVIEVVALRWKWLFIYPDQHIATVNYVEFPEKTPIQFELTADETPMNSFWIPQLGGQIYAMSGMNTQTHLMADTVGVYNGRSTEINGSGYSDMTFTAKSVSPDDFASWLHTVKQSPQNLDTATYNKLAEPSTTFPTTAYASTANDLYTTILMKYMAPTKPGTKMDTMNMDNM